MNIGFISQALPYLPSKGGFRLYGGNLIRCLAQRNRIDLISLLRDDDVRHLDWPHAFCASVKVIPTNGANLAARMTNFVSSALWGKNLHHRKELGAMLWGGLASGQWDVLHVEGAFTGGLIQEALPVPKVLSLHDSWTLRCEEMLQCSQDWREKLYYRVLKYPEPRYERLVYPRFDSCVVVADRDVAAVKETVPDATVDLIPYGTDTEYFHPVPVAKQEATLVFHSHLGYAPNIAAALEFANDIFPLIRRQVPEVVFHLVGARPVPDILALATRPGIKLSADLPDLREAVCSARIYVCAIRHGTGLKSKVLEAMAMRLPIVCYPGSTVGIECVDGQHLLVANDPQEFARYVLDLLKHSAKAEVLAHAGRQLVVEKYSWDSRARMYEDLYRRVIESRRFRVA